MTNEFKRKLRTLREQKRPVRFLISRILVKSQLCRFLSIRRPGYKLFFHPTSLSMALWVDPSDRGQDSVVLEAILRPGDIFADVGANIGHLTIEGALLVKKQGQVFSFEAHPKTFGFLMDNVRRNNLTNFSTAQVAIGSDFGWIRFSDLRSDDQNKVIDAGGITVPMIRLDHFLDGQNIKLLKIDVEGFEKFVLDGCIGIFSDIQNVYFEVMDKHFEDVGVSFTEIFDLLTAQGFVISSIQKDSLNPVERAQGFPQCRNLLAHRKQADSLKALEANS